MSNLTEKAMLVRQAVNVWSGRKFDKKVTREVLDHHNAQTDAGRWNKSLVAKAALGDVNRAANLARSHHYEHTLSWEDWGARILPAAAYFDYMNEQRGFKTAFDAAADQFERNYVQYVSDAKAALNGMFDPNDYPDVYDIRARFDFETIVSPLPDSDDFRVSLNASEVQRIQADIESRTRNILHDATDECWKRLYKSVEHMTERLSDADNRFHDTLVGNLRDLVDLLPKLNIADDPQLERMRQDVATKLCRNDPSVLRPNSKDFDKAAREQQADDAEQILDAMSGYVS